MKELLYDRIDSPIGTIVLFVDDGQLCALDFTEHEQRTITLLQKRYKSIQLTQADDPCGFSSAIRAYFAGNHHILDTIPVNTGGTAFQQQVWSALRTIPAGMTISYGELATRLGRPAAYRAVGAANGTNPIPIVLPCHRVIGSDRSLTGYGGGLERKEWLLHHEGATLF